LARHWPHLVLLDLDWPQAQALRPQLRGVPVILLADDPPAPDTAGASALRKPVAPEELRRSIEAALAQAGPAPSGGVRRSPSCGASLLVGLAVAGLTLLLLLPVLGFHGLPNLLELIAHKRAVPPPANGLPQVRLVPGVPNALEVPPEVARTLG